MQSRPHDLAEGIACCSKDLGASAILACPFPSALAPVPFSPSSLSSSASVSLPRPRLISVSFFPFSAPLILPGTWPRTQRPIASAVPIRLQITNHMPRDKWDSLHPSNFRLITSAILSYSESGPSVREMSRRDTEVTPASEQRTRPAGSLALPSGQEVAQDRWRQRARAEHSQMAYPGVAPMRPPEDHQGSTGAASVGGASVGAASVGAAQGAYGPKPHVNVLRQAQMAWALNTLDPQRARSRDVSPGGEQALAQRMAQVTVDPPPAPQGRVLPGAPDLSVHRSALSVPNQSREAAVRQGVRPVDVAGNGPWVHHPGYPHMHAVAYGGQMGMAFPVQPQYMQGRYAHRQPIQGQFVHAQYAQGQPMQGQFVHAQYAQGQPIQGQFIHAQYAQGQPIQGQFLQTPPQAHQAFHGADTLGSAGQMQAGSGHAQGGEAAWKGPDQKGATLPPGFDQKVQVMGWGDISTAQQGQGGAGFRPRRRSRGGTVPAAVEMTWTPPADRPRRRSGHGGPGAPGGAAVMGGTRGDGARGWEAMEGPSVGVAASLEKRGSHSGALEPSLRKSGMSGALEDVQEETTRGTPATPRELEGAALSLGRTDIGAPSERLLREARCTMEEGSALAGEGPARATRPSDGGSRKGSRKGFGFFRKKSAAEEGQVDKVKKVRLPEGAAENRIFHYATVLSSQTMGMINVP